MKISFLGADQNVTGSKHLIQSNGFNLLLDCGMYQGRREESNRQNSTLPFLATEINAVILSHAHLDHCGTLPILVKNGFTGKIYCTPATAEIAKYILLDSAEIQKQDAEYFNAHLQETEKPITPIYTKEDVENAVAQFEPIDYFRTTSQWTQLNKNIRFKFYDAGHILGSAIIFLEITEGGKIKTLGFTGDIGKELAPILRDSEPVREDLQNLITECTYGDRNHRPVSEATADFGQVIKTAIKNKGKIIIPAFSLGRTQDIIYTLHKLLDKKAIPSLPIYVDSPLAENITDIFPKYIKDFDADFWKDFGSKKESPFLLKNLTYIRSVEESKNLNNKSGPMMIISASGMCEGGRVLHHLKNNIENPQNIVLLAGYQAEHTLGRKLQEGVSPIKIYGKSYDVRAQIKMLNEFSAHAGQNDLLQYILQLKNLEKIFLVHTEPRQSAIFKDVLTTNLPGAEVEIPAFGQSFEI